MIEHHHKNKIIVVCVLAVAFACTTITACSSIPPRTKENPKKNIDKSEEYYLTKGATELYSSLFPATLRTGSPITVKNISRITSFKLRTDNTKTSQLGVCAVNFSDDNGFVLMTTGKATVPIAIVESGNFNFEKEATTPQDSLLYSVIGRALEIISTDDRFTYRDQSDYSRIEKAGYKVVQLIPHKLKTSLNQRGPYFFPYRPTDYAGCVPVAITQILIYYKAIKWKIKGRTVNWKQIEDECAKNGGELSESTPYKVREDLNEVLWWVGLNSGSQYNKDGTGTFSYRALNLIRKNGYYAPKMYNYNIGSLKQALQDDKLIYMDGGLSQRYFLWITWASDGHAWVADGYAKIKDSNDDTYEMVHINWGWGKDSHNGYFLDNVFDTASNYKISTNPQSLRSNDNNETHFKYNVEMTPVSPL